MIYSVKKLSSQAAVAVKFEDEKEYYIYFDKSYHPDSPGSLIEDLALGSGGLNDSAYKGNTEYKGFDTEKVWEMLTENNALPDVQEYCRDQVIVPEVSLSYVSPYIRAVSGTIGISEKGYLFTNICRNGAYFYIGEDKAGEIIRTCLHKQS